MERPNLESIIQPSDVYEKAGRKYCKWSRIAYYLNNHAKGWNFQLKLNSESPTSPSFFDAVWKAPDGSGYLMCYFTDPQGGETGLFPYAIMDNRNNPIKIDRISARDVSDSHRRALAACAAFTFSLVMSFGLSMKLQVQMNQKDHTKPDRPHRLKMFLLLQKPLLKKKQILRG